MLEEITEDQLAMIWSGNTASLANVDTDAQQVDTTVEATDDSTDTSKDSKEIIINDKELDNLFVDPTDDDDDEDDSVDNTSTTPKDADVDTKETTGVKPDAKKPGRKPTDLVSFVSQLVDEEILEGYEDDKITTIEEAKELIKLNLQKKEKISGDAWWDSKVSTYSPQVQAILHYAEQGGRDIVPLMDAIAKVEETSQLSLDTEKNQEEIVRQVLKLKRFDDEEIEDQITTLKDLDKLKAKAEKFLPELQNTKQAQVQMMMQKESERRAEAEEATRIYLTTVQNTLTKDTVKGVKLQREDKAKIYDALAAPRYTSLNGERTNGFVKALEEMQFGKNADYEHFLNIVHMTVDPEGFREKLKQSLKNEIQADTVKKLKSSKTSNSNLEETFETKQKKTITKSEFKNPFG